LRLSEFGSLDGGGSAKKHFSHHWEQPAEKSRITMADVIFP
jgi:hypothetical protein